MTPAYRDRERDILDQLALGQINKDKAGKLLTELYRDYYEAQTMLKMTNEAPERN